MRVVPRKVTPPKRKYHNITDPETGEIPFHIGSMEEELVRLGLIDDPTKNKKGPT